MPIIGMLQFVTLNAHNFSNYFMPFPDQIKTLRKDRKLSQQQAANQMQLTRASLVSYEQGRCEPNIDTLKKIAAFYGVTVDQVIGSAEIPDSQIIARAFNHAPNSIKVAVRKLLDL